MRDWDSIVVGGGLAGSAAACWLSKKGERVLLVEKELVAHHKVCGEFLSHEVQYYMEQLGIDLVTLGAVPVGHVEFIRGDRSVLTPLPFCGMSLSRYVLDETLLRQASLAGAEIQRGVKVSAATANHGMWEVQIGEVSYKACKLFLATGKCDLSTLPRTKGWQNDFIGFKMHYQLSARATKRLSGKVQIVLFRGGYAGLELVENGVANLCLIVKKSRFIALDKRWENLFADICKRSPRFAEVLADANALWEKPLAIYGIPYGFVHRSSAGAPGGLYRLGDQMAVIPSFSGDGMAMALHTAALAADSDTAAIYHARARKAFLRPTQYASFISLLSTLPILEGMTFSLTNLFPSLLPHVAAATRLRNAA